MNNNKTSTIACPACNAPITFDVDQHIAGKRFSCNNCNAVVVVGMDSSSKLQIINS